MILSVASGKGGTGKTTVAVNLALSMGKDVQILDCDVEEPNVHVLLKTEVTERRPVYIRIPRVAEDVCTYCGECAKFCRFNAILALPTEVIVFPELCHGCGGCKIVCPSNAIVEEDKEVGEVLRGFSDGIEVVYGVLKIGEPMPTPVVREVKKYLDRGKDVVIDAPPGTSCPLVHSVYGSDFVILVAESTPFGLHDLRITVDVLRQMKIPFGVVVNFKGIGDERVYEYCKKEGIPIMLEIPFSREIAELYSRGIPFVKALEGWKVRFRELTKRIEEYI